MRWSFLRWADGSTANARTLTAAAGVTFTLRFGAQYKLTRSVTGQGRERRQGSTTPDRCCNLRRLPHRGISLRMERRHRQLGKSVDRHDEFGDSNCRQTSLLLRSPSTWALTSRRNSAYREPVVQQARTPLLRALPGAMEHPVQ